MDTQTDSPERQDAAARQAGGDIEFLRNIYFFHSLPEESLSKILALCTVRSYVKGDILFFEDMPGDSFFIVLDGELEIWKRYGQNDGVLFAVTGKGQPVGEMALIDNRPRSATVRARSATRVFVIKAADFQDLLRTDNSTCIALLRSVTMMVRRSNESHLSDLDRQNRELTRANAELKAAQDELALRERLSVIGRFSSLILHDIRNPLSALRSRVELLKINHLDEQYFQEAIQKIGSDINRMEMLAAEFLDYARGELRLQMSVCDIGALLSRLAETIQPKLEKYGVELLTKNEVQKPVILDAERMLRALVNACENACKAMPSGGSLTVSASCGGDELLLAVTDTGTGMAPEVLEHLFEPFYSVSPAGGTGLGMLIIKSVVDAHHGTVSIVSREGEGTTVSIRLPLIN